MGPDGNNNLLNSLMYRNLQQSSESQSEASSSAESDLSDINGIALQLGISSKDVHVDRFRVDRQKLENMIKRTSPTEGLNAAEYLFDNIIRDTETRISWPCRLKIGAKTKKDPHVKIYGRKTDVMEAKERILKFLDSRGCRVIMKMDISFTDHSYIIGRGGNNIKKIMEDTLTHIHFPDSNRSSQTEKSNQVSLCGSLEGVEKARALVRFSTPLIISYELPMSIPGRPMPDNNTEYVKEAEVRFNVQVRFVSRAKLHTSVLVKGCEKEADQVRDAARQLCFHMCGSDQIQVNLQLRISPQHHDIVKGKNNIHLLKIMEHTNTKIIFPDLSDANIKPIEKSQVTITGIIDGVYRAKQQLIGNLPVALIFDYPENFPNSVKQEDLNTLMNQFGVFITARHKQRQGTLCIVIKGIEKYVDKIYEARHKLLSLPQNSMVDAEIPATYFSPTEQDFNTSALVETLSSIPNSPLTPGGFLQNFTPTLTHPFQNQYGNRLHDFSSLTPANLRYHALQQQALQQQVNNQNMVANAISSYSSGRPSISPRSTNTNTSGYLSHSNSSICISGLNINGSSSSLEQLYPPYKPAIQMNGNGLNHFPQPENQIFVGNSNNNLSRHLNENEANPFETENRLLTPNFYSPRSLEFDRKRVEGLKAMDRFDLNKEQVRTPTDAWAKFSLSKTSPFALESSTTGVSQWTQRESLSATTGLVDSVPWSERLPLSQFKDIHSLLSHLKLEQYISNFVVEKIDMKMFVQLTGEDLLELKIKAFGARKRLLMAINQLNAEKKKFVETPQTPLSSEWIELSDFKDIPSLFAHLDMGNHIENFIQNEIDLKTFVTLTCRDLAELGVQTFIERKRMLLAIDKLKSTRFAGSAAVGAERRPSNGGIPETKLYQIS